MIRFLDELNVGIGIQRHDLRVVQPDRGLAVLPGYEGFTAGKAYIVQQEAGSTENIQDVHRAFMTKQPDGGSLVRVGGGGTFGGADCIDSLGGADCDKRNNQ